MGLVLGEEQGGLESCLTVPPTQHWRPDGGAAIQGDYYDAREPSNAERPQLDVSAGMLGRENRVVGLMHFFPLKLNRDNFMVHMQWFYERHFSSPAAQHAIPDLIRYILVNYHPYNAVSAWRVPGKIAI